MIDEIYMMRVDAAQDALAVDRLLHEYASLPKGARQALIELHQRLVASARGQRLNTPGLDVRMTLAALGAPVSLNRVTFLEAVESRGRR